MYIAYSPDKIHKDIGQTRQLVIDDDLIAVVKNVTRRQHAPTKTSCQSNHRERLRVGGLYERCLYDVLR